VQSIQNNASKKIAADWKIEKLFKTNLETLPPEGELREAKKSFQHWIKVEVRSLAYPCDRNPTNGQEVTLLPSGLNTLD
jgi:hypothetical protein